MKAKLYHDERVSEREADDSWSIYLPLPKKMRKKTGLKGYFLGCKPTEYGMIRCTWEEDKIEKSAYLGKRIDPSTTPKLFKKCSEKSKPHSKMLVLKTLNKFGIHFMRYEVVFSPHICFSIHIHPYPRQFSKA